MKGLPGSGKPLTQISQAREYLPGSGTARSGLARRVLIGEPMFKHLKSLGWKPGWVVNYTHSLELFTCYMVKEDA